MTQRFLCDKANAFAIRIVRLHRFLKEQRHEHTLSQQLLRSGTSIGANISEAFNGESLADFIHKLRVAHKECGESLYWIKLLHNGEYLTDKEFESINKDGMEMMKILSASILTAEKRRNKTPASHSTPSPFNI